MAVALVYSISKILSATTSNKAVKPSTCKPSLHSPSISSSTFVTKPKPSLGKVKLEVGEQGLGNVTHRISRSRKRVPKEDRRRSHPFHLSSSRSCHRTPSNSYGCENSSTTDFIIDKSPSRNPFLDFNYSSRSIISRSKSREPSRTRRHIMWEDSGYDSPSLKSDNLDNQNSNCSNRLNRTSETEYNIAGTHSAILRPRPRSHAADMNSNLNQIRSSMRSLQPPSLEERASSKLYGGRSRSEGRFRGMSPSFTSTPIKSERTESTTRSAVYQLYSETESRHHQELLHSDPEICLLNSVTVFPQTNRRGSTSHLNSSVDSADYDIGLGTSTSSTEMKEMLDDSLSRILEDGTSEFDGKYAEWILQVFRLQLSKMQSRLNQTFTRKLDNVIRSKESQYTEIQEKYRNKLLDFEAATVKFQNWIDALSTENEQLRDTKDAIIEELELEATTQQNNIRLDMEKQANELQAEAEKDKLKLQRTHADQLRTVSDKCMDQITKLEEQYQHQVDSLQKLVTELKTQIIRLESELGHQRNSSCSVHHRIEGFHQYIGDNYDREQTLQLTADLRLRLAESEKEKTGIVAAHKEEIVELQTEAENRQMHLNKQLIKSHKQLQRMELEHEVEITKMMDRLHKQEKSNQKAIDDLRRTYGTKISQLTATVEDLQRKQMYS